MSAISGVDRVISVPGKYLLPVTILAGGVTSILLSVNNFGARLMSLGAVFQEHKYISMNIKLHPGYTAAGQNVRTSYVVAYYKVPPTSVTTSAAVHYQGSASRYSDASDTLPVSLQLPSSQLLSGPRVWYLNGNPSATEDLDRSQGVIVICPISTTTGLNANVEISFVCHLRGATTPTAD